MVRHIFSTSQRVLSRQSSSILSAASIITGASLLSSVFGFIRNRLLVSHFFATPQLREQLDAYWVAFRLPELVFQLLVVGALSAAFIPIYSKYREKNEADANRMAASMLNIVMLVFFVLSVVIFIGAVPFNRLITSENFSAAQVDLAASLTRVMLLAQLFFAASNFMTGIIQANHRFLLPALSPIAYNVGIILGIIGLTPVFGIFGPAIGVVIGACLHFAIQWPLARNLGFRFHRGLQWRHPGIVEMSTLMVPRTLSISVDQLELLASVFFATALPAGNLTILNLAQQLMSAPLRVFSVPIGQASLPFLSKEVAQGELEQFKNTLTQTINQVLFLAFPASALLMVLRVPLVRLAYGSADFPWSATLTTSRLVAIMTLAIFAYGILHVVIRAYYALHDTRTPFFVAMASVLTCIALMAWFVWGLKWGVMGIGLALTVANILETLVLVGILEGRYRVIRLKMLFASQVRVLLASVSMGLALWGPMRLLDKWVFDTTRTLPLIGLTVVVTLIGGAVYLALAYLLKIPELSAFTALFSKLRKWQHVLFQSEEVIETTPQSEAARPW